ncbi:helix-turn-helix domain-containing protein [Azorhizobium doebereinerae]|uniref:helix-turn-helix domain-containing protein n=1 Tax=Azorhizobium doebereinerae TaxID=281091 RepID=UPI00041803DC|nr:helix-turn-helix domain-containing protein [Azorhizobium doebereinerae]
MSLAPPRADPQEPLRFRSADFATPELAAERFRALTAELCDVIIYGDVTDFHVASATLHLSGALLLESRTSALRYDRTAQHVARGIDHFQVVMYLAGGAEFVVRDRTFLQRAGDICIIDMSRPSLTREMQAQDGATHVVSFVLPRLLLTPLTTTETGPTVRILPRETPYGRMLGDYMLAVRRCAAELTHGESQAVVQSLALLVASAIDGIPDTEHAEDSLSQDALRARIKLHIDANLGVGSLGIESLCREFGLSRTGLYRLLAPQSPAGYIQQRRLHRAFAMLISPAFRAWRIIDIALECQFSSDATFIRAFRRQFGLSPGEARRLSEQRVPGAPPGSGKALPEPDAEASRWIAQLTGTMLAAGPT